MENLTQQFYSPIQTKIKQNEDQSQKKCDDYMNKIESAIENIWKSIYITDHPLITTEQNTEYYRLIFELDTLFANHLPIEIFNRLLYIFETKLERLYGEYYHTSDVMSSSSSFTLSSFKIEFYHAIDFYGVLSNTFCCVNSVFTGHVYCSTIRKLDFKDLTIQCIKRHVMKQLELDDTLFEELFIEINGIRNKVFNAPSPFESVTQLDLHNLCIMLYACMDGDYFQLRLRQNALSFYDTFAVNMENTNEIAPFYGKLQNLIKFENFLFDWNLTILSSNIAIVREHVLEKFYHDQHFDETQCVFQPLLELFHQEQYDVLYELLAKTVKEMETLTCNTSQYIISYSSIHLIGIIRKHMYLALKQSVETVSLTTSTSTSSSSIENWLFELNKIIISRLHHYSIHLSSIKSILGLVDIDSSIEFAFVFEKPWFHTIIEQRLGKEISKHHHLIKIVLFLLNQIIRQHAHKPAVVAVENNEFENTMHSFFTYIFAQLNDKDLFLKEYVHSLQKKILHHNINRPIEQLVYYYFEECLSSSNGNGNGYMLHKYKTILDEMDLNSMYNTQIFSFANWHDLLTLPEIQYSSLLAQQSHEYNENILATILPERLYDWNYHYSIVTMEIELQEGGGLVHMTAPLFCCNMFGMILEKEWMTFTAKQLSDALQCGIETIQTWLNHLLKQQIIKSIFGTEYTFPGDFYHSSSTSTSTHTSQPPEEYHLTINVPKCSYLPISSTPSQSTNHVLEVRKEVIDAMIVKTLKKHTTLPRNLLLFEIKKNIKMFKATDECIEQSLVSLIDKEYISIETNQDNTNYPTYSYIA